MVRRRLDAGAILGYLREKAEHPPTFEELVRVLGISRKRRAQLRLILDHLLQEGLVVEVRGGRYGLPTQMNLVTGTLQGHPDGFGFVLPDEEGGPDLFIPRRHLMGAMHGDRVVARIENLLPDGRREGRIVRILERFHREIVGRYEKGPHFGFVVPSNPRIPYDVYIPPGQTGGARTGEIVVARILVYPQRNRNPEGEIVRRLGRPTKPGITTERVIEEYRLPREYPPEALEEAEALPDRVTDALRAGRVDLRDLPTVTIDGERARDFDDAVSIAPLTDPEGGYRLWVHIADVSAFVPEGSCLDQEAYARGTSVYFPDRVLPMFPERLSNDLCSLGPREDRLTLTVEMDFDARGRRVRYRIYESVIRSRERMTYQQVKEILEDQDPGLRKAYDSLVPNLEHMAELCRRLRAKRMDRGSIDFDLPEPEVLLDLQGRLQDVLVAPRYLSHQIIEEFMLAANETVAQHGTQMGIPMIYRIHESPDEERILAFHALLEDLGIRGRLDPQNPKTFQQMLDRVRGRPEEKLISQLMLRSMKQARYAPENLGHFGLAASCYTHFTSPIRRYPDLVVQRLIRRTLRGRRPSRRWKEQWAVRLPEICRHASERERIAMEAERELVDLLKLQFMVDRVGLVFDGIISGVAAFGFFVELSTILVEGLVRVTSLHDDFYHFDPERHLLQGIRRGRVFRLGDPVRVRVERVDLDRRRLELSLA